MTTKATMMKGLAVLSALAVAGTLAACGGGGGGRGPRWQGPGQSPDSGGAKFQ